MFDATYMCSISSQILLRGNPCAADPKSGRERTVIIDVAVVPRVGVLRTEREFRLVGLHGPRKPKSEISLPNHQSLTFPEGIVVSRRSIQQDNRQSIVC